MKKQALQDAWHDCPRGTILATSQRPKSPVFLRRRQQLGAVSGIALFLVIAAAMVYSFASAPEDPLRNVGPTVRCATVMQKIPEFCNNRLERSEMTLIGRHLNRCPKCRQCYLDTCQCNEQCPDRLRNVALRPCGVVIN